MQAADTPVGEKIHWKVLTTVDKYKGDYASEADILAAGIEAYERVTSEGNLLMNAGIQRMLDLLIGAGGQALDNTHARLGVGNSSTAESASQTDLQASAGSSNRQFVTMDATFPSRSSQTLTFKASFTSTLGNFQWLEWCIDAGTANGTTVTAPMLNRKVPSGGMGTKSSGTTWVLTVTITIA